MNAPEAMQNTDRESLFCTQFAKQKFCPILYIIVFLKFLTLSETSPGFYVSAVQVFWKTQWQREKLIVTSNFSFSHSVF